MGSYLLTVDIGLFYESLVDIFMIP